MRKAAAVLAALLTCVVAPVLAEYSVSDRGEWPKSWPKQLELLRKQSRTLIGPMVEFQWFAIPFTKREAFEAAWPYILKVRAKDAPVFLVSAPNFFLGGQNKAGVVVQCPPLPQPGSPAVPEAPIAGVTNPRDRRMYANYIELVVDDDIVNLKRITIPKGVKVIDKRKPGAPETVRENPVFSRLTEYGLDAIILHPLSPVENHGRRPNWVRTPNAAHIHGEIPLGTDSKSEYLVQALPDTDGDFSTPSDQVIADSYGRFDLYVRPGQYKIRVWKSSEVIGNESVVFSRTVTARGGKIEDFKITGY